MPARKDESSEEGSVDDEHNAQMLNELRRLADPDRVKNFIAALPMPHQKRVRALQGLQKKSNAHHSEFKKEQHALDKKYEALFGPLFEQRAAIIRGEKFAAEADAQKGLAYMVKKDQEGEEEEEKETPPEVGTGAIESGNQKLGIPKFWLTALSNCSDFASEIEEHDIPALEGLTDIQCSALDHPFDGFTLKFLFKDNEFFDNSELTKMYMFESQDHPGEESTQEVKDCQGCEINWKPGKNLTVKTEKRKQRSKKQQATRWVTKTVPQESFFRFFSPPKVDDDDEDDEDEGSDDKEELLERDCNLGVLLRDAVIPHAVEYYCNEVGDDSDDDDDDEEDEEEEEDEEDDEPSAKPKGKAGGKGGKEECKQQ